MYKKKADKRTSGQADKQAGGQADFTPVSEIGEFGLIDRLSRNFRAFQP